MAFLDSLHEVWKEAGSFLGVTSAGALGWAVKRFQKVEKNAHDALELAGAVAAALKQYRETSEKFGAELVRVNQRIDRALRDSRQDFQVADGDLKDQIADLRSELASLRDTIGSQQERFDDYVKGDTESWAELHRSLGQIEGRLEAYLSSSRK